MSFCTRCGKELADGEKCSCKKTKILSNVFESIKSGFITFGKDLDLLERNKSVVPDVVSLDDGETPIKQYKLARFRSKIRGQYAEGRLQITNKRLLFRAPGFSSLGKTIIQQEFDINEISGVEVQKGNKISVLNIIGAIILSCFVSEPMRGIFESIYVKAEFVASMFAVILFLACLGLFFILKNKSWIKLLAFSGGMGALLGTSGLSFSALDIVLGFKLFTFINILIFLLAIGWFYLLLQVSFIPDLIFSVKTNSANDAIQIRRRIWGFLFKQPQENSGFSEVLPWTDTEQAAAELGAIINDLQTLGDMAIDKWKE